ncbi:MAG: helix-turn-helix domain-containing protein [Chloroflexi bacterium]|nr:helix-turn-helix domain-containing protein [Chloroflexota bacterium]
MPDLTKTITIVQLAEQLGITVNAVHSMRHRGNGPRAIRIGRRLRFLPEDITSWLEQNREPA